MATRRPQTVPIPRVKIGDALTAERYNRLIDAANEGTGTQAPSTRDQAGRRAASAIGVETTARVFFVS